MYVKKETVLWLFTGCAVTTYGVAYIVEKPEQFDLKTAFSLLETTVTVMAILYGIFVTKLWRWKLLSGWLVRIPYLGGQWTGNVIPVLDHEGALNPTAPICANLTIRQKLFSISCVLSTNKMTSTSFAGQIIVDEQTGARHLVYSYTTQPRLTDRKENPIHEGTARVSISQDGKELEGIYWTNRLTHGEIKLSKSVFSRTHRG